MIRRSPRPQRNYTVIHNEVIRDGRLSWKARGLLIFLLSQPDDWHTSASRLARQSPDGRAAILSGLHELELAGYIQRRRIQNRKGYFSTETVVYDTPSPECGFPTSDNRTPKEVLLTNHEVFTSPRESYMLEVSP